jgi:hypothetical protein
MDPSNTDSASNAVASGTLRFSNGAQVDGTPCTAVQRAPAGAASGRDGEQLFFLLHLSAEASPQVYEVLRSVAVEAYWRTPGSTTGALRKAAIAANNRLVQVNSSSHGSRPCLGDMACAVLHEDDLFVLQAGRVCSSLLHRGRLQDLGGSHRSSPIGKGEVADVRVSHAFSASGDTLLLAAPSLTPLAGGEPLDRLLADAELPLVLSKLAQTAAESDFTALVARRSVADRAVDKPAEARPAPSPPAGRERDRPPKKARLRARTRVKEEGRVRIWARRTGPKVKAWLSDASRSAGRAIASAGAWLARSTKTVLRRTLPGRDQTAPRSVSDEPAYPEERRALMRGIAVGIPVVVAVLVALAYLSFGADARFQRQIQQAQQQIDLAAAAVDPDEARDHLRLALQYASDAVASKPDDPEAARLKGEAEAALDVMDHIVRLTAVEVWDCQGASPSQLVARGQMLFVLDSSADWLVRLDLNVTGDSLSTPTSFTELAQLGHMIGVDQVAELVDCAWVDTAGGRETSGLVVLDHSGGLLTYDPGPAGQAGGARVTRCALRDVLAGTARSVDTFQGRLYLLDPVGRQIWRYVPEGDSYPYSPEPYYASSPPRGLDGAIDMAIDGSVYVLHDDGAIIRSEEGESYTFDPQGMAGDLSEATALALDPSGPTGHLYVADPGLGRIVVLAADGTFVVDYRPQVPLDELSPLAVDETLGRLYFVSSECVYSASLP